ncbi:membrane protein insertase YidC [Marinigracilibium pacificum]|uniref:Membrane protein insertase YidC n=1 Tax=Marinigracilibium pacificum TaxID=2729599 RepID=A0A848J1C4_9BACT|nr:membrane protein insertase YidC [Marinigracilibium pacificum]NMM50603.1 membrane protein insertase YidC [Marinigracilibium pacificum]
MDRNQAIGLSLIAVMFIIYTQFFFDEPKVDETTENNPGQTEQVITESNEQKASEEVSVIESEESDSVKQAIANSKYGAFAPSANGNEDFFTLENNLLEVKISSKGAIIKSVRLKDRETYLGEPLFLIDENSSKQSLITEIDGKTIDLTDLFFSSSSPKTVSVSEGSESEIKFESTGTSGKSIIVTYKLAHNQFTVDYDLDFKGVNTNGKSLVISWDNHTKRLEKQLEGVRVGSRPETTINYFRSDNEEFKSLDAASTDPQYDTLATPVKWFSMSQKYFSAALIADKGFTNTQFKTITPPESDTTTVKELYAKASIPLSDLNGENSSLKYYFGPNNYYVMEAVEGAPDFKENVRFGWKILAFINKGLVLPIFHFLERFTGNYGLIIFMLVLIIKLMLSPLTYKSYKSMAKMKVLNNLLKPETDQLKEKYGDDQAKVQQETMKLYQKMGVSPFAAMSGCIPMLLQMPILFALFNFFPYSVELRGESFLWANDLSTYDSIATLPFNIPFYGNHVSLFTLLMTLSTILMTYTNSQMNSAQMQGPMKTIQYFTPVIIMFVLNSFPAGLTYYYFLSNTITFGQQTLIKKFMINEEKIEQQIEENRKLKGGKKSKFQSKLEEAMKAQEAKAKKTKKK